MINNNEKELNNLYYSDTDSVNQKPKSDWRTGDRTIFKRKGSNSEKKITVGKVIILIIILLILIMVEIMNLLLIERKIILIIIILGIKPNKIMLIIKLI